MHVSPGKEKRKCLDLGGQSIHNPRQGTTRGRPPRSFLPGNLGQAPSLGPFLLFLCFELIGGGAGSPKTKAVPDPPERKQGRSSVGGLGRGNLWDKWGEPPSMNGDRSYQKRGGKRMVCC